MNILRQAPFPLTISYTDLDVSTDYVIQIHDDHSKMLVSETVTSDSLGTVEYELDSSFSKFDKTYAVYIYSLNGVELGEVVLIDNLYIYRPYINPLLLGETEEDIEKATNNERLARLIIDSITGGFYYEPKIEETVGLGIDYLPLKNRANRVNYVYENNVLVYDRFDEEAVQQTYYITADHSALAIANEGEFNRSQSYSNAGRLAMSDSWTPYTANDVEPIFLSSRSNGTAFPKGYDYSVYLEVGWPVVPQDIKEATRMLMDDIACGKLSHITKYVREYETDQFKLKYEPMAYAGTGNMIVDGILSKYVSDLPYVGVL